MQFPVKSGVVLLMWCSIIDVTNKAVEETANLIY